MFTSAKPLSLNLRMSWRSFASCGTRNILTTDQRGFPRVELPGGEYFRILPYD